MAEQPQGPLPLDHEPGAGEPLRCDHICLLLDGHVERGVLHQYGYELPSPRALVVEVETLRAELAWVRSVVTLHQQNGCGVDLARIGAATGGDRPPYPTLELEQLRADRDRWKAANEAALAHNEEYGSELERLRAAVDLHHEDRVDSVIASWCVECEKPWPCPTVVTGGGHA